MKLRWLAWVVALTPSCYDAHPRTVDAANDAAPDCAAMEVRSLRGCAVGVPTYWSWTGSACEGHVCACAGRDCTWTFTSEVACMNTYARCAR